MGKEHAPSAYRKIIKASKSGKVPVKKLIEEARALSDMYYVSQALYGLSLDPRLDKKLAGELRADALELVKKENREWRRAELITTICKFGEIQPLSDDIIKLIKQISEPKARADAISGTVKSLGCENASKLLQLAVSNTGQESESCKPVIKFWIKECKDYETIIEILDDIENIQTRIRLLGYLQLQLVRARIQTSEPLEMAIETADQLPAQEKLFALKDLASQSEDIESLEVIVAALTGLESPIDEASLLVTLAGSADKAGARELATDWFNSAQECLNETDDLINSAGIRLNLAIGYQRLGQADIAQQNFQLAMDGAKDNEKLIGRIEKAMGKKSTTPSKPVAQISSRHVLALHDTYEGSFSSAHIKMIATAAPLCIAYGLDLALIDFPANDLDSMVKKVSADTNIGKGGRYLKELANENRIVLAKSNELDRIGLPVATTSRPAKGKQIDLDRAVKIAGSHPKKRICVIMGLGRKGLPRSLLDSIDHHAEITGSNVALETSTAMGIIAQMMGQLSHPKF